MPLFRLALLAGLALASCADKYPPCDLPPLPTDSKGDYVPPDTSPSSGLGEPPPSSYPGGGELADDNGYMQAPDGSGLCACSAELAKVRACDVDPDALAAPVLVPSAPKDGVCDFRASEGDPDCALPGANAQPQTPSICGEVYWCCAWVDEYKPAKAGMSEIKSTMYKDIPLCGYGSRHVTFHRWLFDLLATFGIKSFLPPLGDPPLTGGFRLVTANCYTNPRGSASCGNYPEGEAP